MVLGLAAYSESELQGVADIIRALASQRRPFDVEELQALGLALHAAHHFLTRWAAGAVDLNDMKDAVAAGTLMEVLEHWRDEVERHRPKTALTDRRQS